MAVCTKENLSIRDVIKVDLDALIRLKPSLAVHCDRIRDARQPGFRYLVLELDHRIIGFVCLVFVRPPYWSDGDSAEHLPTVIDFLIDLPLRGRGYGSFFLQEVEKLTAEAGGKELYLWVDPVDNPRAYSLYMRLGYHPLQEQPYEFHWEFVDSDGHLHSGDNWRVDMVKSLQSAVPSM